MKAINLQTYFFYWLEKNKGEEGTSGPQGTN
jgi:hypothetical protein